MELINLLNKKTGSHWFDAVKAGKYKLSIQASDGHYCTPRATVPVDCYTEMELAIFRGKKSTFISANRSSVLRKFPRYNELIGRVDCPNSGATVYGYVPVDLLNDLYLYLKQI